MCAQHRSALRSALRQTAICPATPSPRVAATARQPSSRPSSGGDGAQAMPKLEPLGVQRAKNRTLPVSCQLPMPSGHRAKTRRATLETLRKSACTNGWKPVVRSALFSRPNRLLHPAASQQQQCCKQPIIKAKQLSSSIFDALISVSGKDVFGPHAGSNYTLFFRVGAKTTVSVHLKTTAVYCVSMFPNSAREPKVPPPSTG